MSHWLHPEAEFELTEAAVFYAKQASRQIASAFLTEFERVIALLVLNQGLGSRTTQGLRVYPFRRFPYSVVYRETEAGPRVYAIAHQKRKPGFWRGRL